MQCRLVSGSIVVYDWAACPSPATFDLAGAARRDVRRRDPRHRRRRQHGRRRHAAPTSSTARRPTTPTIIARPGELGSSRQPAWSLRGAGRRRATSAGSRPRRRRVQDWTTCAPPYTYDLTGQPDGALRVLRARGRRGRATSAPRPATPTSSTRPSTACGSTRPRRRSAATAARRGRSPARTAPSYSCRIARSATAVQDWASCSSPFGARPRQRSRTAGTTSRCKAADFAGNPSGEATGTLRARHDAAGRADVTRAPSRPATERVAVVVLRRRDRRRRRVPPRARGRPGLRLGAVPEPAGLRPHRAGTGTFRLELRATDLAGNTSATGERRLRAARAPRRRRPRRRRTPERAGHAHARRRPAPVAEGRRQARPGAAGDAGREEGARRAAPPSRRSPSPTAPARCPQRAAKAPRADEEGAQGDAELRRGRDRRQSRQDRLPALADPADHRLPDRPGPDRPRDPKLALAPVFADPDLEFRPATRADCHERRQLPRP